MHLQLNTNKIDLIMSLISFTYNPDSIWIKDIPKSNFI